MNFGRPLKYRFFLVWPFVNLFSLYPILFPALDRSTLFSNLPTCSCITKLPFPMTLFPRFVFTTSIATFRCRCLFLLESRVSQTGKNNKCKYIVYRHDFNWIYNYVSCNKNEYNNWSPTSGIINKHACLVNKWSSLMIHWRRYNVQNVHLKL